MSIRKPRVIPCQVGDDPVPALQDLEVVFVFRQDTEQFFFMDLNVVDDVPEYVCAGLAMTNS